MGLVTRRPPAGWEGCSRGFELWQRAVCISLFEILFLGALGCCAPDVYSQSSDVLAGGVTLSGGMKIAHCVGFSQKMVQLTVEWGWGGGSLCVGGLARQKVALASLVQGFWCIKIQSL